MEILNEIWVWIVSALGGVSLAGVISAAIYGCLKGAFSKTISKIDVEKIAKDATDKADEATEKGIDKVKAVSFSHSIQPLVESELKKINELSVEVVKKELNEVKAEYKTLINIVKKLSAYFDNSIGVSDTAKQELKQAIAEAENEPIEPTNYAVVGKVEEEVEAKDKTEREPLQDVKKATSVER